MNAIDCEQQFTVTCFVPIVLLFAYSCKAHLRWRMLRLILCSVNLMTKKNSTHVTTAKAKCDQWLRPVRPVGFEIASSMHHVSIVIFFVVRGCSSHTKVHADGDSSLLACTKKGSAYPVKRFVPEKTKNNFSMVARKSGSR